MTERLYEFKTTWGLSLVTRGYSEKFARDFIRKIYGFTNITLVKVTDLD